MSKIEIKPIGDRVLIKPGLLEKDKRAKSIIILQEEKEEPREEGDVVAVGPGVRDTNGKLIPMPVKVGDHVLFTKYGPEEINIDGEKFVILAASGILATIK